MNQSEKLDILKEKLKDTLSISDVFERYFYTVKRKGNSSQALCPFHDDKSYGNFHINESKGFFKCFNCGEKGDVFTIVQKSCGCDFPESIWILARDYNFITQEEFKTQNISIKNTSELIKSISRSKRPKVRLSELASREKINFIYNIFSKLSPLTDNDKEYLINTRGVDEKRVDLDYFTMPYCTNSFMDKLIEELKLNGFNEKDLLGVPGFYLAENDAVLFIGYKGIAIKIRNSLGEVTGIQVRLHTPFVDKNKKVQRYIWFSSHDKHLGCSSGSPLDVSFPLMDSDDIKAIVFLTEGKFKSEQINQHFNSISISIQGVASWRNKIRNEILKIQKISTVKGIFICYDSDMISNLQVYQQCKSMVEEELDIFHKNNIFIVVWDISLGKGIDDLINNNHKDKVKKIQFYKYVEMYENFLKRYNINQKGEVFNKDGQILSRNDIHKEFMNDIFPLI